MINSKKAIARITALAAAVALSTAPALSVQNGLVPDNALTACAYDPIDSNYTEGTSGNILYAKYSDHIEVRGCTSGTTTLNIPSTIDGLPVTAIMRYGFQCSSLTSVTIPDSVKTIGYYAFSMSSNLTSITFPDSLEVIEMHAFEYCSKLDTVKFPNKLVKVHDKCFDSTPWLNAKRAENPLVIINGDLIDASTVSGDVTVPSEVKYVSPGAFSRNSKVTSVVFPAAVKEVCDNTFFMCDNLTSVDIKGVTYIGLMAFDYCEKLRELKLSSSLKKIDEYAFADINSQGTITFYGTREQWESVEKAGNFQFLNNATMVYDNSNPDPDPYSIYPVVTSQVQGTTLKLSWDPIPNAQAYAIAYYTAGKWKVLKNLSASTTTFTYSNAPKGTFRLIVGAKINGDWDKNNISKREFRVTIN